MFDMLCSTGEKQNLRWFSNCRINYRKLGDLNCKNAGGLTNMKKTPWSQSLKSALSPPPAPVKGVVSGFRYEAPPPPNI